MISISIVSHQHGVFLSRLISQLNNFPEISKIILTINTSEYINLPYTPNLQLIKNKHPQGFGSNHNTAFRHCNQPYFCILNPDIEFRDNPFTKLLKSINEKKAALAVPQILSSELEKEDNIRTFPTIHSIFNKIVNGSEGRYNKNIEGQLILNPDWAAGMFMLFRSCDFAEMNGFDERYFLYYEDVDICARLHKSNKTIVADLNATAIHHAQRTSHKNFRYMRWHLTSMIRYLWTHRDL